VDEEKLDGQPYVKGREEARGRPYALDEGSLGGGGRDEKEVVVRSVDREVDYGHRRDRKDSGVLWGATVGAGWF
jgi:hypothetical protein